MMRIKHLLILALTTIFAAPLSAQVTFDPFFAGPNDTITVYFDASQGNGELDGVSQVYAHTGVITDASTGPSDWKYVQGNWGQADPNVAMTNLGNNIHSIEIDIQNFYGVPAGEEAMQLAFVFRNADGSLVGRASDGGDIFVPLFTGYGAQLINPTEDFFVIDSHITDTLIGLASDASDLNLFIDDSLVATGTGVTEFEYVLNTVDFGAGKHYIIFEATDGTETIRDSSYYLFHTPPTVAAVPAGMKDGANYLNDSTIVLVFTCPIKEYAYVIGDHSNWELDGAYNMNRTPDSSTFWVEITGLDSGAIYRYQYAVGAELIRVADPYTRLVLDGWNDGYIDEATYPNLPAFPVGKATNPVAVWQTGQTPFEWDTTFQYQRPEKGNVVAYELLIRDFTDLHSYQSVIDSLPYLQKLGINTIELMPVNEFEGNNSWGYNPSFYFAADKYYGTENKLKELIEEAHKAGIAVVIDMVLNHSFGQSPLVRLFWDGSNPSEENPWFRTSAAHDFNVGYDFDHESPYTQKFVDDVMRFWVEEYHVDGYRMDLSKGFTNKVTLGDVGAWGQYDSSRIAILSRMADEVWNYNPETYIILEHFADNAEEKVLANYGFMLWGHANYQYRQLAMGYGQDVNWTSYKARGWNNPNMVTYMESHDEERILYSTKTEGRQVTGYNIREIHTGLDRAATGAVYFFSTPGPKMIWQFGEMGYDLSINRCENGSISNDCRLSPKPPRWYYLENSDRKRLFDVYAAMLHLKETYPAFSTTDFDMDASYNTKTIQLNDDSMNVFVICNFNMVEATPTKEMQHTGMWYEYFSGDSLDVTNVDQDFVLQPAEYRVYTDVKLAKPEITAGVEDDFFENQAMLIYPNPADNQLNVVLPEAFTKATLKLYDLSGRIVGDYHSVNDGFTQFNVTDLQSGMYLLVAESNGQRITEMVSVR